MFKNDKVNTNIYWPRKILTYTRLRKNISYPEVYGLPYWHLQISYNLGQTLVPCHSQLQDAQHTTQKFSFRTQLEVSTLSIFWFYLSLYFPNIPSKDIQEKFKHNIKKKKLFAKMQRKVHKLQNAEVWISGVCIEQRQKVTCFASKYRGKPVHSQ